MNAAPSHTTVTLAPDAHAYLVNSGLVIASAGGVVGFHPPKSMPAVDLAAIASQLISVLEQMRDTALERDAQVTGQLIEQTRRSR